MVGSEVLPPDMAGGGLAVMGGVAAGCCGGGTWAHTLAQSVEAANIIDANRRDAIAVPHAKRRTKGRMDSTSRLNSATCTLIASMDRLAYCVKPFSAMV